MEQRENADPGADASDLGTERRETEMEQADRNYAEVLQELRVAQVGVQILVAFLLSLAFAQRFTELETSSAAPMWSCCCSR